MSQRGKNKVAKRMLVHRVTSDDIEKLDKIVEDLERITERLNAIRNKYGLE